MENGEGKRERELEKISWKGPVGGGIGVLVSRPIMGALGMDGTGWLDGWMDEDTRDWTGD